MTAGAMLLYYQVAKALIMGLAPLFIFFLVFDQTKELFRQWLMYAVGTLFSMAVLNAMVILPLVHGHVVKRHTVARTLQG